MLQHLNRHCYKLSSTLLKIVMQCNTIGEYQKSIDICTDHVYRVSVYQSAVYQISYQRHVKVIAMAKYSEGFLQLIIITL